MNTRIREIANEVGISVEYLTNTKQIVLLEKFAELIVEGCLNREALLGAIARGWCSEKNAHKIMDPDLAVAIFDEVEKQIRTTFRS